MEQKNLHNILVIWRGKQLYLEVAQENLGELGQKLQDLTNVRPDTLRLFVPQSNNKGSKMLSPFSNAHSSLSLKEAAILEGKPIKMMGVSVDEIEEVSQNSMKDLRIIGFDEEEKRLRQRALYNPQTSLKLPQGTYIFSEFRTLHIPGIELNPPPSQALRRMHMLACDPGIIAIMNKHHWRVGIMTEMAPEGYVGISPKCILGFNKNQGEEISLRLRTDDLKGFRKYESIKKTLLHELAHMVYSEHDINFFALNKQLNEEAVSLDWTKSNSHMLSGRKFSDHYEEEIYIGESSKSSGKKLGGRLDSLVSPRSSSATAAYNRLLNASCNGPQGSQGEASRSSKEDHIPQVAREPDPDDIALTGNQQCRDSEPDPDEALTISSDAVGADTTSERPFSHSYFPDKHDEPDPDDSIDNRSIFEYDPDDDQASHSMMTGNEPDPDDFLISESMEYLENPPDTISTRLKAVASSSRSTVEPGLDVSGNKFIKDVVMEDVHLGKNYEEPDPDDSAKVVILETSQQLQPTSESSPSTQSLKFERAFGQHMDGLDHQELQNIEEPAFVICSRLQKAIDMLRSEVTPVQATAVLQTLFKIIRNVIEHPDELKFRRLRKANPQFQRNVANYKAALEVLTMVGFCEDVISDEVGRAETFLVLKRDDPGLLWLAKSSLELSIA